MQEAKGDLIAHLALFVLLPTVIRRKHLHASQKSHYYCYMFSHMSLVNTAAFKLYTTLDLLCPNLMF